VLLIQVLRLKPFDLLLTNFNANEEKFNFILILSLENFLSQHYS